MDYRYEINKRFKENPSLVKVEFGYEVIDGIDVLDIGCGVGKMASRLIELDYRVDGVSPSSFLTNHARQLVGEEFHIFECPDK